MEEVEKFLKEAETYYLATVEGDQPRVRPFGTAHIFEGKLYIQTGKKKDVSKQLHANPKAELCAYRTGKIGFTENTSGLNGRNAIARKRQNELVGADPPDEEPGHPHD